MGQSQSKDPTANATSPPTPSKAEEIIDLGYLLPQGIYPTLTSDFDHRVVRRLIQERRLAPFYKGLADEPEDLLGSPGSSETSPVPSPSQSTRERSGNGGKGKDREGIAAKQRKEMHRKLYGNGNVECPICFLYYPENTNHARCCDQPICTECFVQIRRPPESPSTPASCPFCVEPNFGVMYHPPEWSSVNKRSAGVTSAYMAREGSAASASSASSCLSYENRRLEREGKQRRKSVSHRNPEVVTIDNIRPDWTRHQLEVPHSHSASRRNSASSAHGSNQPIVSRRLVGRTAPNHLSIGGSSRSRAATEYGGYVTAMRQANMNMDLEELMVMEAIRMSLLEQEAREAKERGEGAREATGGRDGADVEGAGPSEAAVPNATQRIFQEDDNFGTDIDSDTDTDSDTEGGNQRYDPIVTVTEHSDDSPSLVSQPLAWGARNKAMPPPPPREDTSSSSSVGIGRDFKIPIREVGESSVIEQPEEGGSVF